MDAVFKFRRLAKFAKQMFVVKGREMSAFLRVVKKCYALSIGRVRRLEGCDEGVMFGEQPKLPTAPAAIYRGTDGDGFMNYMR